MNVLPRPTAASRVYHPLLAGLLPLADRRGKAAASFAFPTDHTVLVLVRAPRLPAADVISSLDLCPMR